MRPDLTPALRALAAGELVVYPTDTLFGLAARAEDPEAVARVDRTKGRPSAPPVSVAVSSVEEVDRLVSASPSARRFLRTHLPGPYTVLLRPSAYARRRLAPGLFSEEGTLGVRVPDHPIARELARRAGPLTATSANLHGRPPCRTLRAARRAFGATVRVYLAGGPLPSGRPSTLIDLTRGVPRAVARR